jgi:hypothetical protein
MSKPSKMYAKIDKELKRRLQNEQRIKEAKLRKQAKATLHMTESQHLGLAANSPILFKPHMPKS